MEVMKQAVAVPIFATVIWLTWVIAQAYGANLVATLLGSLLLLAVAGWFLGRWPARRWAVSVAGLVVLTVVGLILFSARRDAADRAAAGSMAGSIADGSVAASGAAWQPWSAQAVKSYQAQGRPVMVDFTASWCLSCQVNERVALEQPSVQKAFQDANVALLKADWTRGDDAITQTLAGLGRSGVPAYALYVPGQAQPTLLPEALTPGIVIDAVEKLPKGGSQTAAAIPK
jgi:thiol:disulfide interchange protein DsbD